MRERAARIFWAILTDPAHRQNLLREGWKAVARVFVLAIIMDAIYQVVPVPLVLIPMRR